MRRQMILTIALLAALVAVAGAATWTVSEGSEVVFTSKAPMESFDGKTEQATGYITCSPDDLSQPIDVSVTVDLASLDTGLGLRNTHMRERHLETDKFPEAIFTGGTVTDGGTSKLIPGATVALTLSGRFDLHGVTRDIEVPAEVTMTAGGDLEMTANFVVKLSDHDIKRPKFLVMKLADEQQVRVALRAQREAGP